MTMSSLRDHTFNIFYGPADNPLENFYLPALSASVQYDGSAGYFSLSALAVAATGVSRLIQNGGRMRLLEDFPNPQDALMHARLEVLAWMVAEGQTYLPTVRDRFEDLWNDRELDWIAGAIP